MRYYICHATASNPLAFDTIKEVTDYRDTTYVDTLATANTQQNFYYIITDQSASLPDIYSDTLSTIHLTVDNSDDHLAILDFNEVNPSMPGYSSPFSIMLMQSDSSFAEFDQTADLSYEYPVLLCSAELSFRIELPHDSGCVSISNIYYAAFSDDDAPSMPSLDSVSIDPFTGEVLLGWSESTAPDAGGYVIYHAHVTNDTLDFVDGKQVTAYTDLQGDPCEEARAYAIATYDTCGNIGPGTYDIPQRTILLDSVVFHPCEMVNSLSWSPYINMVPALAGYRVFLSTDGGSFELLATLPPDTLAYEHEGLDAYHSYEYFVRAFSLNDEVTSTSCIRSYSTWQYPEPQENMLDNASVFNSEGVELFMMPDTQAYVPSLRLYRSDDNGASFFLLEEFVPSGAAELFFEDLSADVNAQSYDYKTSLIDSCGNEVLMTLPMRTIFLQGEKADGQANSLNWNAFEGWAEGVDEYVVYRAVNEAGSFEALAATANAGLSFEDDFSDLTGDFSMLRYIVAAFRAGQLNTVSYSNEIFFEYEPTIFMPNAFTPGGMNPVFRPEGTFAQFTDYRMDVYNRWGELIFTSNDFGTGWDGTHNGKPLPAGVYVCTVNYRSRTGDSKSLKSSFLLIR